MSQSQPPPPPPTKEILYRKSASNFRPLYNKFHLYRRTIFLMWVGGSRLARAPNNPPPPWVTQQWPGQWRGQWPGQWRGQRRGQIIVNRSPHRIASRAFTNRSDCR